MSSSEHETWTYRALVEHVTALINSTTGDETLNPHCPMCAEILRRLRLGDTDAD